MKSCAVDNGAQALQAVASLDPDVVLLDISMPIVNGIDAASRLRKSGTKTKVIFLTAHTHSQLVSAAFSTGALGYVVKPRLTIDLVPAIHNVLEGQTCVSPTLGIDENAGIRRSAEAHDGKLPAF